MNNPLPVDPFSVAEAARRTWPMLIEAMLDAVCLVEPTEMRVVAANAVAGRLFGVMPGDLVGRDMRATAATPEDAAFWDSIAAGKACGIVSETLVLHSTGAAIPVLRRVSRVEPAPGTGLFVLTLHDRSDEVHHARSAELALAQLAATLESVGDGVLVVDLGGHISKFNRRFAALWDVPEEMLALQADDEIFDWMRRQVAEPLAYVRRLAEIDAATMLEASDELRLRSGAVVSRMTRPQCSRGRPIGRVFSYRIVAEAAA